MEKYIKYQRIEKTIEISKIQEFLDELILGGWEIIYYSEKPETENNIHDVVFNLNLILLIGKKQIKNI